MPDAADDARLITRRGAIATAAAGTGTLAAASLAPGAEAKTRSKSRRKTRSADVVVLGAGLAGLSAALALVKAGRSVIVLEARKRVGGRTLNETLRDGSLIEHGGQFLFDLERENQIVALAKEFGLEIIKPTYEGDNIYHRGGQARRYPRYGITGRTPPFDPVALAELFAFGNTIDGMAREVDSARAWAHPRAEEWDSQTFYTFIHANTRTAEARFLLTVFARSLAGSEPRDLSLLYVLRLLAGTGGMTLQQIAEAPAYARFLDGVHALPVAIAKRLGKRVMLGRPVQSITQDKRGVRVKSGSLTVAAKRVIVAFSPTLTGQLRYDPPLPSDRAQLVQRFPQGCAIKVHGVYDTPFWREDGLTGESVTDLEPVRVTEDVTLPYGAGLLEGFITGASARRWTMRSPEDRRRAVLENFEAIFGPKAAKPRQYVERVWSDELYTRGCFYGVLSPGVLVDYGEAIRRPVGRIHWAGTETATQWSASIEGAVRSGQAAAGDVLALL